MKTSTTLSEISESVLDWNCAMCLFERIEIMYDLKPNKKNKDEYEAWKKQLNEYIYHCNKLCKSKIYDALK